MGNSISMVVDFELEMQLANGDSSQCVPARKMKGF